MPPPRMTKHYAQLVLTEFMRRNRKLDLLEKAFPKQQAFLKDDAKEKAALCTRRSGKSMGIGLWLFDGALKKPGTKQLYIALTRESARRIMWSDVLLEIKRKNQIDAQFNKSTLEVNLSNGSSIILTGAENTKDEPDKLLGQKFFRVAIDECASFTNTDLRNLIYSTIKPALTDHDGEIALIGTPSNYKGYFYEITSRKEPGWSVHQWSALDNPHVKDNWEKDIERMISVNPLCQETPGFKQNFLGEWYIDTSSLCYSGWSRGNNIQIFPDPTTQDFQNFFRNFKFIFGIDFGFNDASAITVVAYDPKGDKKLYIIKSESKKGLIISDVADWIKKEKSVFNPTHMYCDHSKQIVQELRQRHGLHLINAIKTGFKADAISMLNSDFVMQNILVCEPGCKELIKQMETQIWDPKYLPIYKEKEGMANDCCDSMLYAWRHARNYLATPDKIRFKDPYLRSEMEMERYFEQKAEELTREEREDWNS